MADILKMFKVVINALFKKSACEMYPIKPARVYDNTKGQIEIDAPKCILCTLCDKKCPTHAIKVDRAGRTWKINYFQCIYCNNCVEICPKKCLNMSTQYSAPEATKEIQVVDIPETKAASQSAE